MIKNELNHDIIFIHEQGDYYFIQGGSRRSTFGHHARG